MSQQSITGRGTGSIETSPSRPVGWASALAWFAVFVMLVLLVWVGVQRAGVDFTPEPESAAEELLALAPQSEEEVPPLPEYNVNQETVSLVRFTSFHTIMPESERPAITTYEVVAGDSVMGIATQFDLKPETILWANYDLLQDNPNNLSIGQKLKIPAVDGVLYQWKKSDNLENIAHKFKVKPDDILTWPDNKIADISNPEIAAGSFVMVPGGSRELVQWVVPIVWRARSGANKSVAEGCDTSGGSYMGSGVFGWPTDQFSLSGNDFWSGHLGIDISALTGDPVFASDSGVVVYAGGIGGGYGLMVMIDHGNGYHTLYAHNSQIVARCGSNVGKGQVIAYAGSTGNSTGPHLHFEIRYNGAFINPWDFFR